MPRFSIILPCYNAEATLADTLRSLVAQTCGDWEALVIDDGSEMRLGPDVRALFYTSAGFAALLEELSKSRMG